MASSISENLSVESFEHADDQIGLCCSSIVTFIVVRYLNLPCIGALRPRRWLEFFLRLWVMKMAPTPTPTPTTSRSRIVDVRVRAMRLSGSEGYIWAHPKTVSYTAARCTSIGDYLCGMEASHTMSSVLVL